MSLTMRGLWGQSFILEFRPASCQNRSVAKIAPTTCPKRVRFPVAPRVHLYTLQQIADYVELHYPAIRVIAV